MIYKVKKNLSDASIAHRLRKDYPNKCKNIHGHSYHFAVEFEYESLNQYDMSIDFGDIKKICDKFIQDNWDHAMLISNDDANLKKFLDDEKMTYFILSEDDNSTAEKMAEFLCKLWREEFSILYNNIKTIEVMVWETDTSVASCKIIIK